jgi:hypothetical protein
MMGFQGSVRVGKGQLGYEIERAVLAKRPAIHRSYHGVAEIRPRGSQVRQGMRSAVPRLSNLSAATGGCLRIQPAVSPGDLNVDRSVSVARLAGRPEAASAADRHPTVRLGKVVFVEASRQGLSFSGAHRLSGVNWG